jgi:hypothetical protein
VNRPAPAPSDPRRSVLGLQALGLLLFLFIPVVLALFVVHPAPVGGSLALGVALMIGHRFLAVPYMRRVAERKCLWSNGAVGDDAVAVDLVHGGGTQGARVRRRHEDQVRRFYANAWRWRWPLRLGIFLPLLGLLITLGLAAGGVADATALARATDIFRLTIGITVQVVAWGWLFAAPTDTPRVPFPVHNFFLLGIRNLLWILRLVGIWWIVVGGRGLLGM